MEAALSGAVAAAISTLGLYFSAQAAKNSKPVGNGFTKHVLDKLDELSRKLDNHTHP